jgi:hypothetical protein
MMICVFRCGGGAVLCEVLVLCGAGGGLTVQPPSTSDETSTPTVTQTRRARFGTPNRVSGPVPTLAAHDAFAGGKHGRLMVRGELISAAASRLKTACSDLTRPSGLFSRWLKD